MVQRGFIPPAPERPTFAFSLHVLKAYHTIQLRCAHLSIQQFVKALCDLHGSAYSSSRSEQFTIIYDVYLSLIEGARERALRKLGRSDPDWRLKNCCPCCTNKLAGEEKLEFDMLFTMDGNDSLKRVSRRESASVGLGRSKERLDLREAVEGGYYLPPDIVDRWSRRPDPKDLENAMQKLDWADSPCSDRWKNMSEVKTAKAWGVFDETGIFVALCRHGFILVLLDMRRSGELSKYPLAVVEKLLNVFGPNLGGGYDIGCGFITTLRQSLLGELAQRLNYRSLVGAFHGHAHNRLCQLDYLATYTHGLGLEDLETAERFFSKSNALASSTRYASRFHCQQKIVQFIKHNNNFEVYSNLSKFIFNNYKQALELLAGEDAFEQAMKLEGVMDKAVFPQWLAEEKEYLTSLKTTPTQETLEMEYLEQLVLLAKLRPLLRTRIQIENPQDYSRSVKETTRIETQRRHATELISAALKTVQELELDLGIQARWTLGSEKWAATEELIRKRNYQRCLDQLESLVVARLFIRKICTSLSWL
ncbi:hypothetical protein BDN72DRAFT_781650 [Pluteus cervinus]|uniref:Uncharacterized protein n=1 Tax=Pluteus cervinus TaxID=181527 RepID=A0ACD2ZZ63_9AGAR|nr:hypothetical protein BDN72DRAFT_781650 [Pluteus cervinus]